MATTQGYTPHAVPPHSQGNGLAIASLVLGIIAVVLCWVWFIGGVLGLLAIIFGAIGLGKAKRVGRGKGAALAGLILGIVGIVLAVVFIILLVLAVGAVESYATKGRKTEASLHLNMMEKRIKMAHLEHGKLPDSTQLTPSENACANAAGKNPPVAPDVWFQQPGWKQMEFHIDESTLFQYRWTKTSETAGYAEAIGDLDCDTTMSTYRVDIEVVDGRIQATHHDPTPD